MEAVRLWTGVAAAFHTKDSIMRRLLASVCYEFGTGLATRFQLARWEEAEIRNKEAKFRRSASDLFWSRLQNLHSFPGKFPLGSRTRTLRSICGIHISNAISQKIDRCNKRGLDDAGSQNVVVVDASTATCSITSSVPTAATVCASACSAPTTVATSAFASSAPTVSAAAATTTTTTFSSLVSQQHVVDVTILEDDFADLGNLEKKII